MNKFIVLAIFLSLIGCQSSEVNESMASKTDLNSPITKSAENDLFSVGIFVPQEVKLNEEFTIKADFTKKTEQKLSIVRGEKIFYFIIKDSSGKQINSAAVTDLGTGLTVLGKRIFPEEYKYKISEPGNYDVAAIAEFTVNDGENNKAFKMETDHKIITVEGSTN